MSESSSFNQFDKQDTSTQSRTIEVKTAPYQKVLAKAFDKLTSEILIFLLAYTILLIGLLFFGSHIPNTWRNLLYLIPILGVLAYIWLNQISMRRYAEERDFNLRDMKLTTIVTKDNAYVGGILSGATTQLSGRIRLFSFWTSGDSSVIAISDGKSGQDKIGKNAKPLAQEMLENFEQLDKDDQLKTIQAL